MTYAVTGLFAGNMALNHHLYVLNIILIFILMRLDKPAMFKTASNQVKLKKWLAYFMIILIFIAVLSIIAINTHGEIGGSHNRFPLN